MYLWCHLASVTHLHSGPRVLFICRCHRAAPPPPLSSSSTSVLHGPARSMSSPTCPRSFVAEGHHQPPSPPPSVKRRRLSATMREKERVVRTLSDVSRNERR